MSDLDTVAAAFKKWKGNRSYCRYPECLWEKAHELTNSYSLSAIAAALGTSAGYLEQKFSKRNQSVTFASIQVSSPPAPIKIEFKQVTIHADESQAISMIQTLMGGI